MTETAYINRDASVAADTDGMVRISLWRDDEDHVARLMLTVEQAHSLAAQLIRSANIAALFEAKP